MVHCDGMTSISRGSFAMLWLVAVWFASGVTLRVAHAQMLCSDYDGNNMCLGFDDPSSSVDARGVYDSKGPWDTGTGQQSKQAFPLSSSTIQGSNFLQQNVPPWLATSLGLDKDPETVMVYHGTSGYAWVVAPPQMNPQVSGSRLLYAGELPRAPNDHTPTDVKAQGALKGLSSPHDAQRARKNWFHSQNHPQTSKSNGFNKHKPFHQHAASHPSHHIHHSVNTHKQSSPRQHAIPKAFQSHGSVSHQQPGVAGLSSLASGMNLDTSFSPHGRQRSEAHTGWFSGAQMPETPRINQYEQPIYGQHQGLLTGYAQVPTGAVFSGEYEMTPPAQNPARQPFPDPVAHSVKQPFTQQSEERPNFTPRDAAGQNFMGHASSPGRSAISVHGGQPVLVNQGAVPGPANVSLTPQNGLQETRHPQNVPLPHDSLGAKPQQPVTDSGGAKMEPGNQDGLKASAPQASAPQPRPLANQEPVEAQPKGVHSGSPGTNGAPMPTLPQEPGKVAPAAQQPQQPTVTQAAVPQVTQQPVPGGSTNPTTPGTTQADALRKVGIIKR